LICRGCIEAYQEGCKECTLEQESVGENGHHTCLYICIKPPAFCPGCCRKGEWDEDGCPYCVDDEECVWETDVCYCANGVWRAYNECGRCNNDGTEWYDDDSLCPSSGGCTYHCDGGVCVPDSDCTGEGGGCLATEKSCSNSSDDTWCCAENYACGEQKGECFSCEDASTLENSQKKCTACGYSWELLDHQRWTGEKIYGCGGNKWCAKFECGTWMLTGHDEIYDVYSCAGECLCGEGYTWRKVLYTTDGEFYQYDCRPDWEYDDSSTSDE